MVHEDELQGAFAQEDHQVAFILDDGGDDTRPVKRRKVSKAKPGNASAEDNAAQTLFVPMLNGTERTEYVNLRHKLYQESWSRMEERIVGILRDSNSAMLDSVCEFVNEARSESPQQIPSAFIVTGPNIASQGLLFDQLSETLRGATLSKFVTLRSADATTLKAVLKKIIRDATARNQGGDDDGDDVHVGTENNGRRYLNYDLEALHASIKLDKVEHIFIAFQDSEGFDSGLLSDLIALFDSWRSQIPFTLLFGVATSVELLQSRLLKSACRVIYGAQFDCVQTGAVLETVFKGVVAAADAPLSLGAGLLRNMLDRQQDQIAGIQAFITSVKYAFMCHFYGNALSILSSASLEDEEALQPEHFEAIRNLASFRSHIEYSVDEGSAESLVHAKSLIEDDRYLLARVRVATSHREEWINNRLRCLLLLEAAGAQTNTFSKAYVDAMSHGGSISDESHLVDCVQKLSATSMKAMLNRIAEVLEQGDASLHLPPPDEEQHDALRTSLKGLESRLAEVMQQAEAANIELRSKYSGQSKVMRTTVIAQKVQLSRDSAALRQEDKLFTDIVDETTELLLLHFRDSSPANVFLSESWLYDSRSPSREVFVPRPRVVFERSLSRPYDYLACSCCKPTAGGVQATLPATSILYHLYQETSSLINVADLWTAFHTLVTENGKEDDERRALMMFYRGLAELRSLGFVKASKKKVDHIAKVKWL